jgi:hypothetical protein
MNPGFFVQTIAAVYDRRKNIRSSALIALS